MIKGLAFHIGKIISDSIRLAYYALIANRIFESQPTIC